MAVVQGLQGIREAYTFDDVLLKPGLSEILPSEADIRSHITRAIPLNIPIIASAMDTVTEARMAIAMAQAGGIGVIHRNFDVEGQAAQVRQVKKFEIGNGGQSVDHRSGCDAVGCAGADEGSRFFRHSGGDRRHQGRARKAGRHSHQPRRALCHRSPAKNLRADDARESRDGARRRQPGRGQADAAQAPHRETARRRRSVPLRRPDHRQGHGEGGRPSPGLQGCAGPPARRGRDHGRRGRLSSAPSG